MSMAHTKDKDNSHTEHQLTPQEGFEIKNTKKSKKQIRMLFLTENISRSTFARV